VSYHQVVGQILDLLKQHNCWYETFEHGPVRTSEEAARVRPGYSLQQGAKTVILKTRSLAGDAYSMLVLRGDQKFDSKKLRAILSAKHLRFATEAEIAELTGGVLAGGVPPFGGLFGLEVYADRSLLSNERIVFNAGDRRFSVAMQTEDWRRLVRPEVVEAV